MLEGPLQPLPSDSKLETQNSKLCLSGPQTTSPHSVAHSPPALRTHPEYSPRPFLNQSRNPRRDLLRSRGDGTTRCRPTRRRNRTHRKLKLSSLRETRHLQKSTRRN